MSEDGDGWISLQEGFERLLDAGVDPLDACEMIEAALHRKSRLRLRCNGGPVLTASYIKREIRIIAEPENDRWVCRCVPARTGWEPYEQIFIGPPPNWVLGEPATYNFEVTAAGIEDLLPQKKREPKPPKPKTRKQREALNLLGEEYPKGYDNITTEELYIRLTKKRGWKGSRTTLERATGRRED